MSRGIRRSIPWLVGGLLLFAGWTHVRILRLKRERIAEEGQVKELRKSAAAIIARRPASEAWKQSGSSREWVDSLTEDVTALKAALAAVPEQRIPELAFLSDQDWIIAAAQLPAEPTADDLHECINRLQEIAKKAFAAAAQKALNRYLGQSGGKLPRELGDLGPDLGGDFDAALSPRYQLTRQGSVDLKTESDGAAKLIVSVPTTTDDDFCPSQIEIGRSTLSESDNTPDRTNITIPSDLPRPVQSALAETVLAYMRAHAGALATANHELKPYVVLPPGESDAKQVLAILDHDN